MAGMRNEVRSQLAVDRGGTGRIQDRLLFTERGEQVEESPLTFVEILSRNHEGNALGVPPAGFLQYRGVLLSPTGRRIRACATSGR